MSTDAWASMSSKEFDLFDIFFPHSAIMISLYNYDITL